MLAPSCMEVFSSALLEPAMILLNLLDSGWLET
jgi:hypothetical protein